jgi:autotransporter translocation and assembly factor TamB
LQASLGAVIHEGQLRGHAVAGNVAADWRDGGLREIDLDLTGEGARVIARGKPDERLELDLAVADLSPFYPDLAGQLTASGWLRWFEGYLTGEVQGSAANIVWQDTSFASLIFNARHLARQAPLALELDGQNFQYGELLAEHLQLVMSGNLEQHDVQVMASGLDAELALQLAGQYRDEVWQAQLQTLSGDSGSYLLAVGGDQSRRLFRGQSPRRTPGSQGLQLGADDKCSAGPVLACTSS